MLYFLKRAREKVEEVIHHESESIEPLEAELGSLSEAACKLWALDHGRLVPNVDYGIDLQCGKKSYEQGDRAPNPLFKFVDQDVLQRSTWRTFIALLDNYEFESGKAERVTAVEKKEEEAFLDACMATQCMAYTHKYLTKKGLAPASRVAFKQLLHDLWFGLYRRKVDNDSSGFEHVFVGEEKDGKVLITLL